MPHNFTFDPAAPDDADMQRKLLYAQLLQKQSLTPNEGQMVSGHYVAPSITQGLARMGEAYASKKAYADVLNTSKARATSAQQTMVEALKASKAPPFKGVPYAMPDPANYGPEAMARALMGNPDTAAAGMELQMQQVGREQDMDDSLRLLEAKQQYEPPKVQTMRQGNKDVTSQWDPTNRTWQPLAEGDAWNPNPQSVVNVDVNGANAFSKRANETAATMLLGDDGLRGQASAARDAIAAIQSARDALNAGSFVGPGGDIRQGVAKGLQAVGINIAPEQVTNTDQFKASVGQLMLAEIKKLGANPSNADREQLARIIGDVSSDPRALQRLFDWRERQARSTIDRYNTQLHQAFSDKPAPYDLSIPQPADSSPTDDLSDDERSELEQLRAKHRGAR